MKRVVGWLSLLCVSIGAMVGSGWLLGPLYAAKIAGPYASFVWMTGGALVMIIALTFAELAVMLPVTGGIARFPHFSHGGLVSFSMTWIAWVAYILLPPVETIALIQYISNYFPSLTVIDPEGISSLSTTGIMTAIALLTFMSAINIFGINLVTSFNKYLVYFKIIVPFITAFALIYYGFNIENFSIPTVLNQPANTGKNLENIFKALPMAGVIFSFFGFRLSIELAGETKNPQIALPLSLLGSILICMVMYTVIQVAFIGAVTPESIANGFNQISFAGESGPFIALASGLGLWLLVKVIYAASVASPFGSALMVVTTNARLDYAMSVNGYMPKAMTILNKKQVPTVAIIVNLLLGLVMLLPFPGWQQMTTFIIAALVISHSIAPISLVALRRQIPELIRPFKLPYGEFLARLAFIITCFITYWTGWNTIWKMFIVLLVGLIYLSIYNFKYLKTLSCIEIKASIKNNIWLFVYFIGMGIISYIGAQEFGGINLITFGYDYFVLVSFALIIFEWGVYCKLSDKEAKELVSHEEEVDTAYLTV